MMNTEECIRAEVEYREWRECPLWYCVKTKLGSDGSVESEIVSDEKTKVPIAIQSADKPLDGVFEDASGVTYYTYHAGYKAAAKQVEAAKKVGKLS